MKLINIALILVISTFFLNYNSAQESNGRHIHFLEISHSFGFTKMNKFNHLSAPLGLTYYFGNPKNPFALTAKYTSAATPGNVQPSNKFKAFTFGIHFVPWTSGQRGNWNSQIQFGVSTGEYRITYHDRNCFWLGECRPITEKSTKHITNIPISYRLRFHPNEFIGMTFGFDVIPSFNGTFFVGVMTGVDIGKTRINPPVFD